MNPKASAANLVQAVKDLSAEWRVAGESWHDVKSAEFQREYLEQIPDFVTRARTAMEELEGLLRKVRSDCE